MSDHESRKGARLIPVAEFYDFAERTFGLQARTVQWYATEGLLPRPITEHNQVFYDSASHVDKQLASVHLLKEKFGLKLWKIKHIVQNYGAFDFPDIVRILEDLAREYPTVYQVQEPDGTKVEKPNWQNKNVVAIVIGWLQSGKLVEEISLLEAEKEAEAADPY